MKCSEDGTYTLRALGEQDAWHKAHFHGIIMDVSALGFQEEIKWNRDAEGLHLYAEHIKSDYPVVFRILID